MFKRGKKHKINQARLKVLSTNPKKKYRLPAPEGVRPGALEYQITPRILKLSVRDNPREDPPYNEPGAVVPQALRAVGKSSYHWYRFFFVLPIDPFLVSMRMKKKNEYFLMVLEQLFFCLNFFTNFLGNVKKLNDDG